MSRSMARVHPAWVVVFTAMLVAALPARAEFALQAQGRVAMPVDAHSHSSPTASHRPFLRQSIQRIRRIGGLIRYAARLANWHIRLSSPSRMPTAHLTPSDLRTLVDSHREIPQSFILEVEHDGMTREAVVSLPTNVAVGQRPPIVFNFHGIRRDADVQMRMTGMDVIGPEMGFITVHPQGVASRSGVRSWNARVCCGFARTHHVDDVGFVSAVIDTLSDRLNGDHSRVFAAGFSNGGFLTYALARALPDRIRAIAPVSALDTSTEPPPGNNVSVFHTHGTHDPIVGYSRDSHMGLNPLMAWPRDASESASGWGAHASATSEHRGQYVDHTWRSPSGAVVRLRAVQGGDHFWSNAAPDEHDPQASAEQLTRDVLEFFQTQGTRAEAPQSRR